MSHILYLQNLDAGTRLAMPGLLPTVLLWPILVDVDLLALEMLKDLHFSRSFCEIEVVSISHERSGQLHRVPDLALKAVDNQLLVPTCPVLLATNFYHCKHTNSPHCLANWTD